MRDSPRRRIDDPDLRPKLLHQRTVEADVLARTRQVADTVWPEIGSAGNDPAPIARSKLGERMRRQQILAIDESKQRRVAQRQSGRANAPPSESTSRVICFFTMTSFRTFIEKILKPEGQRVDAEFGAVARDPSAGSGLFCRLQKA